ncbi:hypothetical protein [Sphingosinicella sp. BN140058]|uniref:hypothetical protein n=1 Tax=Sphingosinicella sp. BN140058 TaxID=1892855 RepID=UPI001012C7AD|nr:hypothetical protein [Sphingosinicella sp. BN140058]QAY78395.1 hypothetical protein ETR14_19030 [Sphingosinicella sp. BN140058]
MSVTAVVELVQTLPRHAGLRAIRASIARSALDWTRSGLLANILVSRTDYSYAIAMLLALASEADDFVPADVDELANLYAGRVIGFSELPILTLRAIALHLGTAGVATHDADTLPVEIRKLIDKRALRTRTDEYDVITLMMAAQILSAQASETSAWPSIFPRLMLTKAIRDGDLNWIAVLALLAQQLYGAPEPLLGAARSLLVGIAADDLLPMPARNVLYSEFFERSDVGLRLRSTIACLIFLQEDAL